MGEDVLDLFVLGMERYEATHDNYREGFYTELLEITGRIPTHNIKVTVWEIVTVAEAMLIKDIMTIRIQKSSSKFLRMFSSLNE